MADNPETAEAPETAAAEEAAPPAGGKKKLIGMIVGALFLVGSSVAVGLLAFPDAEPTGDGASEEATPVEPLAVVLSPLPQILVNLVDSKGLRLLQATITLELETKDATATTARFGEIMPKVQDRLIKILSSMSSTDIDGGTSKEFVQTRIKDHLNLGVIREEEFTVTDVYFTEFVIQ